MVSTRRLALAAAFGLLVARPALAQAPGRMMDRLADRVIQKYQNSSCQQLAVQRGQHGGGEHAQMEQRVIQMLRQNPQMREAFLNRVAAPIANKMFECGFIP